MKPEILHNDHMMFLDRALETQRTALLTAMRTPFPSAARRRIRPLN